MKTKPFHILFTFGAGGDCGIDADLAIIFSDRDTLAEAKSLREALLFLYLESSGSANSKCKGHCSFRFASEIMIARAFEVARRRLLKLLLLI